MSRAPVVPVPSATVVLLRDGPDDMEVLLLRRSPRARFVPGMYVFPGGLVDRGDASRATWERFDGLLPEHAEERLQIQNAEPPAIAYYVAACREAFEETGILVGQCGGEPSGVPHGTEATRVRGDLLEDRIDFGTALELLDARIRGHGLAYFAHWITPEALSRRYDTRFFAAEVPGNVDAVVDAREMTHALWTPPRIALEQALGGELPMILPTLHTLQRLAPWSRVADALSHLSVGPTATIMPSSPDDLSALRDSAGR